jgi:hypothetical protein
VQIFDDGLMVDSQIGLSAEVARVKEYVLQHNQTDLDFLRQRASAQLDLGKDVEITIPASSPRLVVGDRIHIIPEQLQIFPDCVEGISLGVTRVPDITLKRGVVGVVLPPARVFGLAHQASGDAVLRLLNGNLIAANEAWGPDATGPLSGGVRTPVSGLRGFRWELAGNLDPKLLPSTAKRSFRLALTGGLGGPGGAGTAGLDVEIQNGQFAIAADFAALGSSGAEVEAWFGTQSVYTGVLLQQGRVLVDSDFNEVAYTEDDQGIVEFQLHWDAPQTLLIDGQPVFATRVAERLRHRDRAVTIFDYERVVTDAAGAEIQRASVRPSGTWLSAVGGVDFGDPAADPLFLAHLDPAVPAGVEADGEKDPQGNAYAQLRVEAPAANNALDGDERLTLLIQEEDEPALTKRKGVYAPGSVVFELQGTQWNVLMDFAAAGYTGFRVLADGIGELSDTPAPTATAMSCDAWPVSQIVKGVGDELWVRLGFEGLATVSVPGAGPVVVPGVTLVIYGAARPPFPGGHVQLLSEGLETTVLLRALIAVGAPADDRPGTVPSLARPVVLHPAVPNPFNPRTELRYQLGEASDVVLSIYDVAGRHVQTLVAGPRPAGEGSVIWDGRDIRGHEVGSGSYFVRLRTTLGEARQKVVLIR